jgi:Cft2 family RNA processing exonuclease
MKLIPLGGAEEVGATCTLLEIGGHKLMVDAGIRIGQPDPLPDLARVSDFGGIEAILVTHAHTDHTGALPVVHRAYPAVPVYATPGTQAIVNVLFNDALNIMKSRYEVDREIPLYNKELVASLFSRMQSVQLGQTIKLFGGDVTATFFPAGHILGAACIGLQSKDGESAFISGDISVTPQLTVGGMLPPVSVDRRFRPQVVMVESTYGNRMHANRAAEERRLLETVAGVIEQGGRVLIPAFAVGRAQEVLLILANAMARGTIAPFPVWVDGMVRSVCGVYTQFPYDLNIALKRQILKSGNPFYGESAGKNLDFEQIASPDERKRVAEERKPGVIVASSGMLSGGPSAYFAGYIAQEAASAIFITGYQDEESPGRALLALAEAKTPEERVLKMDGETVQVKCRVDKYSLSAHVDAGEVAGLIEQLNPQETVLVHGAGGARESLSDLLLQSRDRRIYLPKAGDEVTVAGRKKKRRLVAEPKPPTEGEAVTAEVTRPTMPATAEDLCQLREKLLGEFAEKYHLNATNRTFTVQEVAQFWLLDKGVKRWEQSLTAEEYEQFRLLLNDKASGFKSDPRRPFLFRLAKTGEMAGDKEKAKKDEFPLEQNAALAMVEKLLPKNLGGELYRKGAVLAEKKLVLYFRFPEPATETYKEKLAEIAATTGWAVELNAEAHQGALVEAVGKVLPPDFKLTKAPGVYRELKEVRAVMAWQGDTPQPDIDLEQINAAYKAITGYKLGLTLEGLTKYSLPANLILSPGVTGEPMEVNSAFALIDQELTEAGARLLKKSLKQGEKPYIELTFVTPEAGAWYETVIEAIAKQINRAIRINGEPVLQALQDTADRFIREIGGSGLSVKKYSFFKERKEIVAKLQSLSDNPVIDPAIGDKFYQVTGWNLKLELEQKQAPSVTDTTIRETQAQMLYALMAKRGWDKDAFVKNAGKAVEELNQAEARRWITQLTEETRGKPGN